MQCSICAEPFTQFLRKKIACPMCFSEVCKVCVVKYLKTDAKSHCMHCGCCWSESFLDHVSKQIKEQTVCKSEKECALEQKAHLAAMQECAVVYKAVTSQLAPSTAALKLVTSAMKTLKHMQEILQQVNQLHQRQQFQVLMGSMHEETDERKSRLLTLEKKEQLVLNMIQAWKPTLEQMNNKSFEQLMSAEPQNPSAVAKAPEQESKKPMQVFPCTQSSCRGFCFVFACTEVVSKCSLCKTSYCTKCRNVDNHKQCNADHVASVAKMVNTTKPCPVCFVPIERSFGCNAMFCTACHTSFDWVTCKPHASGVLHNPHEAEYLQRSRSDALPPFFWDQALHLNITGNDCMIHAIDREMRLCHQRLINVFTGLREMDLYNAIHHQPIVNQILRDPRLYWTQHGCTDLQVQYLAGELTERQFSQKSLKRQTEFDQVIERMTCLLSHREQIVKAVMDGNLDQFRQAIATLDVQLEQKPAKKRKTVQN